MLIESGGDCDEENTNTECHEMVWAKDTIVSFCIKKESEAEIAQSTTTARVENM